MRIAQENVAAFRARSALLDLGRVRVSTFSYAPLRSWRTRALVNRSDPAMYHLALVTEGSMWMSQRGNDSGPIAGDMVLFDTSHAGRVWRPPSAAVAWSGATPISAVPSCSISPFRLSPLGGASPMRPCSAERFGTPTG